MIARYAEAYLPRDISGIDLNTKYPVRELQKPTSQWAGRLTRQSRFQTQLITSTTHRHPNINHTRETANVRSPPQSLLFSLQFYRERRRNIDSSIRLLADDCIIYRKMKNKNDKDKLQTGLDTLRE